MLRSLIAVPLLAALFVQAGCTKPAAENKTKPAADKVTKDDDAGGEKKHDEWWCVEHGMPEKECAQCEPKLAAEFKKKGDWCEQHERPDSQCFICHPELEQKFAARYEAKYGKKPPPREE